MRCKHCKKELVDVIVVCEVLIRGKLGAIHNDTIIEYSEDDFEATPTEYLCPECEEDITLDIKDSINPIEENENIDLGEED